MAKVKFTAIVAQMRGKLAGSVFARGRYGNYIRTLTSPINSNTPALERVRSLFNNVVTGWYNLTDDQRAAWGGSASVAGKQTSFGESFNYTGRVLYIHLNRNLQEIGEALITEPPVLNPVESFSNFAGSIKTTPGSEDISIDFSPAIDANTKVIIYATPVLSRGSVYVNPNKYKKVAVLDNTFVSGDSIMTEYIDVFKTMPATGQRVGFKMKAISKASGKDEYPLTSVAVGAV
jgi:hypothetical protein